MNELIEFLEKLDEEKIYYRLNKVRDSIMVEIAVASAGPFCHLLDLPCCPGIAG